MTTHYEILGVNNTASDDEIKKAYRKMSLQFHPDRNKSPEASGQFQKINDANEILSDHKKRTVYDMDMKGGNPFSAFQGNGPEFQDMNGLFNAFFGGMPGMPGMQSGIPNVRVFNGNRQGGFAQNLNKPPPIMKNIALTLEQAYQGGSHPISLSKWILVNGRETEEKQTVYITVPPGIDENEMIILREHGHQLSETVKGDVKITIKIENNTEFKRQGLDLIYEKNLTLKEALCGFVFDIKHINKKEFSFNNSVNPATIKPGQKKVIPELGMIRDKHVGNLIVNFNIIFPDRLSVEQIVKLKEIM